MAYDPGAIDATLAAAVGDEPGLIAELRLAFADSVNRSIEALAATPDDEAWRHAASRLQGLAASFGAIRLMALAQTAGRAARSDDMLRQLRRAAERL